MKIPHETKEMLLKLREKLPEEKREKFVENIKEKLSEFATENVFSYALAGAAIGLLIDSIPIIGSTSDDWMEIGAFLGSWVGHAKDKKEQAQREKVKQIVIDSLKEAMDG